MPTNFKKGQICIFDLEKAKPGNPGETTRLTGLQNLWRNSQHSYLVRDVAKDVKLCDGKEDVVGEPGEGEDHGDGGE